MTTPQFTFLFCLVFSFCIIAMAALPYMFWRTPETRFALVVYGLLAMVPLVVWQIYSPLFFILAMLPYLSFLLPKTFPHCAPDNG